MIGAALGSGSGSSTALAAAGDACLPASDSCSLASTSTDLLHQQQQDALDAANRTHHLLKHCLSQSQRGTALAHFHTDDPREAAKEIVRMGQRELQAKFKVSPAWQPCGAGAKG